MSRPSSSSGVHSLSNGPLSLVDLESEFERTLNALKKSERIERLETSVKSKGAATNRPNTGTSLKSFLHKKKIQEERLKEQLETDDLVDSAMTNEVLLAELRGIQYEIDEYARLRSERNRMAKSLPIEKPPSRTSRKPLSQSRVTPSLSQTRQQRQGAVLDQFQERQFFDDTEEEEIGGQYVNMLTTEMDEAMDRVLRLSKQEASAKNTRDLMEEYFEVENKNLESVVRTQFDRAGINNIQRIGEELTQRRKDTLAELRSDLEARNAKYEQKLIQEMNDKVETEKEKLRREYDAKQRELESEITAKFSSRSRQSILDKHEETLQSKMEESLEQLRKELQDSLDEKLDKMTEDKLIEKEQEIQRVRNAVWEESTKRQERVLSELEDALVEGANQARLQFIEEFERETEQEVRTIEDSWREKQQRELESIRDDLEKERAERIAILHDEEHSKLESMLDKLRMEMDDTIVQELNEKTRQFRQKKTEQLEKLRLELEAKGELEFEKLQKSFQRDLESAQSSLKSKTQSRVKQSLEEEAENMNTKQIEEVEKLETKFGRIVEDARRAFKEFQRKLESNGASPPNIKNMYSSDEGSDDYGDDDFEDDGSVSASEVTYKAPSRADERVVLNLLENVCQSHRDMSKRLRQCQKKLVKTGKELLLLKKNRDVESLEEGNLRRELEETKKTVQKLFAANHYLKSQQTK